MDKFLYGVLVGILIIICILLSTPSIGVETIISDKRITPEWKLTTDGKIVDTLYIYKNE